jgi:hypothetical protein
LGNMQIGFLLELYTKSLWVYDLYLQHRHGERALLLIQMFFHIQRQVYKFISNFEIGVSELVF